MQWPGSLCDASPVQAELIARVALAGLVTALVIVVGLRILLHRRRTGSSGVTAFQDTIGTPQWWGGVGFVLGFVVIVAGLVVAALGHGISGDLPIWLVAIGVLLGFLGAGGAWWCQHTMGESWGFGVTDERSPELVTKGAFGVIRNPIYTFMLFGLLGCILLAPGLITILGWLLLLVSVQYLVRVVEEPYLLRTIPAYAAYAARAGRFLPGIGRLNPTAQSPAG